MTATTGPDLDALTKTRTVSFWGFTGAVTPVLIEHVFGDGGQVIAFTPLDSRPNYYVVRVDAAWELSNWSDGAAAHRTLRRSDTDGEGAGERLRPGDQEGQHRQTDDDQGVPAQETREVRVTARD